MKRITAPSFTVTIVLMVIMSLGLATAGAANAAPTAQRAVAPGKTVASTPQGSMVTKIVGDTKSGARVTGSFVPMKFSKANGKLRVRGMINGVVHRANGSTEKFALMRTIKVKSINGTPARAGRVDSARASCKVLRLVLRPLDLDLLGLQVHLDKVLLTVIAKSGAGALLGNLVCAVVGLLDGGIGGALGRLTNLLNRILGNLRLGS